MDEKTPLPRSRTKSSAAASKAGSPDAAPAAKPAAKASRPPAARSAPAKPARAKGSARAGAPVEALQLLARAASGDFPPTVYLEGGDEALKAAFLAELRRAWAAEVPEAPQARVL